ncbi:MAG: type IV toxin-antitoxin system AbiEi family antitoxin domain-containing protein [Actinopolymorphaceae bacterium]
MPRRELPAELLTGPFRLADLRRLGLPEQLVRFGRFRRLHHGVYAAAAALPDTLQLRLEAAALILPASAVFGHHTAAALRGLPVPPERRLHVTVPPGTPAPRGSGIRVAAGSARTAQSWQVRARPFVAYGRPPPRGPLST